MLNKDYYTTQEVADLLRVDVQTVRRYIRLGKIRSVKLNDRLQRIAKEEIDFLFKTPSKGVKK